MRKILISVLAISCFAVGAPAGAGNTYDPLLDMTSPLYVSPIPSMGGPISALASSPEAAVTVIVPANQAQTYKFPVHEAPVPKPPPIELEVLTPGCEKLLQSDYSARETSSDPARFPADWHFEKLLRDVLAYHWNNNAIMDTKPETVSVTFAINSKAEFSEFKLDKSSGNKKIDEAALALGVTPKDIQPWPWPCRLPPGSPLVVVFRATLHTTPVKELTMDFKTPLQTVDKAEAKADFGPYLADLQRRIKRAWFPPKGYESKRVVVVFKVNKDGALSNLRLDHASGAAIADQAALKAVENAAPFRPLPRGASADVDIPFTFDYNVFSGGGSGLFIIPPASNTAPLLKSTDYQPPKAKPRKFSLKRFAKHVCLAPVAPFTYAGSGGYGGGDSGNSPGVGWGMPIGGGSPVPCFIF